MAVQFNRGLSSHFGFNPTLQDFKNAFSLTEKGAFKHSALSTKGEFYVRDGKLCSANIHGGHGKVESGETNRHLRQALIEALRGSGATEAFIETAESKLFGDVQMRQVGAFQDLPALKRSDVKAIIQEFEKTRIATIAAKIREMEESGSASPGLKLDEFRFLAAKGWSDFGEKRSAEFNAALRQNLYAAVSESPVPEGRQDAKAVLLMRLRLTLTAAENLKTPLTEDEFLRTMTAVNGNMSYVEPSAKPLADRAVKVARATGNRADLVRLQKDYEKQVKDLDWFLLCYHDVIPKEQAQAVCRVCEAWREISILSRRALDSKKVDVEGVNGQIEGMLADLVKSIRSNPEDLKAIRDLRDSINNIKVIDPTGNSVGEKYAVSQKHFDAMVAERAPKGEWQKDKDMGNGLFTLDTSDLLSSLMEDLKPVLDKLDVS